MSEQDRRFANRRNVIKATAGAGVAGLASQPVMAADDSSDNKLLGPLADVSDSEKYTFDEYSSVLNSEDNGAARLVSGAVESQQVYVGDSRDVTASTLERQFADGVTGDDTVTRCLDTPWYVPDICADLTIEVTDAGLEVTLVVAGYPVLDFVLPKEGSATYNFDVPNLDVSGTVTVSGELLDRCTVEAAATLSVDAFGTEYGPFSANVTQSFC
jgi:hypothetical protein